MKSTPETVIGVDVGSGSVRAGIFDLSGRLLSHAEIWQAVCRCIREALARSGTTPQSVAGIGFDATCSLVVLDNNGEPLAVSPDGEAENNIIVWMLIVMLNSV